MRPSRLTIVATDAAVATATLLGVAVVALAFRYDAAMVRGHAAQPGWLGFSPSFGWPTARPAIVRAREAGLSQGTR